MQVQQGFRRVMRVALLNKKAARFEHIVCKGPADGHCPLQRKKNCGQPPRKNQATMYMELKPPEALRADELAHVTTPFYAVSQLKTAWLGHGAHIRGYDKALEACTDPQHQHWDYQRHGFERLRTQVENGELVLVLDKSWEPMCPAYREVNGKWEVTRGVGEIAAHRRLKSQAQTIQREQREQKAFQSQHPPSHEPETESASGPGNRAGTLGPHVGSENTVGKQNTFKTQHEAAKHVSETINPTSIKENREYGGMIYQNKDGTYGYTTPNKGTLDGVDPGGPSSVPEGTKAVAYYHTHGGDTPGYDNENFSNAYDPTDKEWYGDIPYADANKIDGYLATPKGKFKCYSHIGKKVVDLGNL
jgi:hypothetical protein